MANRRINLEGAVNFRDIGGYAAGQDRRVRWQTVYRSDSLAELTDADVEEIAALDLYGVCDYRLEPERLRKPDRLPSMPALKLITPGFIPEGTEDMLRGVRRGEIGARDIEAAVLGHYRDFATRHIGNYASFFEMLLEADGRPVLMHCTSGKDRTGWGIALLLLAVGCGDDDIVADYTLTNRYRRDLAFMFPEGADEEAVGILQEARPAYIRTALDSLRETYGESDTWLAELGLSPNDISELRASLTEPTPADQAL